MVSLDLVACCMPRSSIYRSKSNNVSMARDIGVWRRCDRFILSSEDVDRNGKVCLSKCFESDRKNHQNEVVSNASSTFQGVIDSMMVMV